MVATLPWARREAATRTPNVDLGHNPASKHITIHIGIARHGNDTYTGSRSLGMEISAVLMGTPKYNTNDHYCT